MASKEQEGTPIDLRDRVKVYATAAAPHHGEGEVVNCAPAVAQKMKDKGWATDAPAEGSPAKSKKDKV